ncbi:MAG: hypothetical protein NTX50_04440, partial [Candidatus Sumerlaeota bacterium]|nr:hypothetical protein [Candidatus Sumerlaeota bacterium]
MMKRIPFGKPAWLQAIPWMAFLILNPAYIISFRISFDFFDSVRRVYYFNTLWMPLLLGLAGGAGLIVARIDRRGRRWAIFNLAAAISLFGVYLYATHIEPRFVRVRVIKLDSPKITQSLRILHVTDIQSPRFGPFEERVFAQMRALNPDLVLMTGDMLQPVPPLTYKAETPRLAALMATLHPPLGVYGIVGSTDGALARLSPEKLGGMHLLIDTTATLRWGETKLRLYGLNVYESHNK